MAAVIRRLLTDGEVFERRVLTPFCVAGIAAIPLLVLLGVIR